LIDQNENGYEAGKINTLITNLTDELGLNKTTLRENL